ncbi:nucleotide-binding universal stress UspA family protein [Haloferula luteola]|uniref:Universal stress protein n=1 Tax=Haloferula luteola TaxID=595692 RepID=A0A840V2G3_9BACT|nr:universal stress protein [Haloferula luteola]MBB5351653.1 nucleotide-binding universal stress UspA family protein [Haloferula luteola]
MKTIVAAVDFSDSMPGVIEAAGKQATAFGAKLHLVHVVEPEPTYTAYGFTPDEFPAMHLFQEEARKRAQARLLELAEGCGAEPVLLEGSPLHALMEHVKETGAELVVLGCHGHGMVASLLLGSVAEGMVRKAVVPTMIVPVRED